MTVEAREARKSDSSPNTPPIQGKIPVRRVVGKGLSQRKRARKKGGKIISKLENTQNEPICADRVAVSSLAWDGEQEESPPKQL
jgi:hypothetical protein